MAVNISSSCIGCEACVPACPSEALYMGNDGLIHVDVDKCTECGECVDICPVEAISMPAGSVSDEALGDGQQNTSSTQNESAVSLIHAVPDADSEYKGVWVFIEQRKGKIAPVSLELLGAGRELSDKLGVELCGVLLGYQVCGLVNKVYEYGADRVYVMDDEILLNYRTETYAQSFVKLADAYKPEIVLMGATIMGRDLAGAVATELATGLTADCTSLDIDSENRILLATRPAFGGNIMATIVTKKQRPQMATVRPKVMRMAEPMPGHRGALVQQNVDIKENDLLTKVLEIVLDQGKYINLQDAEIIVAGGRGMGDKEGFDKICFGLAEAIGARVGGSRAAVEAGWIDQKYQVGQTGVTVAPKIYFALGISGAVQHLVGIRGSDIIIAVNTDPNAPIFKECTYGIIGDVFEIVPLLQEPLEKLLTQQKNDTESKLQGEGMLSCAAEI